jgi:hypothetical protein
MSESHIYTRRDFLRDTVRGTAVLALGLPAAGRALAETGEPLPKSRVVLVRDPEAVLADGACNGPVVSRMLDEAVVALTGAASADAAWKSLLRPEDVLGIKTNVWKNLPTPKALEEGIAARARGIGIPAENLAVLDRGVLDDPVFRRATALVNVRPLRTHHWAGIGGCIKNYILFDPEPWNWHEDSCADLGGVWKLAPCVGKTRLNVLVVLTPLFYGIGPHHYDPNHVWAYKGLLVGTDPVALDSVGLRLLEEKRKRFFEKPPRGGTSAKHVRIAETKWGIGVADPERIEIVRVGWMEEALI